MDNDSQSDIIDLVTKLRQDVMDNSFNNFLFFTYTVNPELFSWFPEKSNVVIYTIPSTKQKIKNNSNSSIVINELDTHAKIYLMWNDEKIVCWLGSFNFTYGSLADSIEWAQRNVGYLNTELNLHDLDSCKSLLISNNQLINQIFDLVLNLVKNNNDFLCDKILYNNNFKQVLLHNKYPNTLRLAIKKILHNYKSDLKIHYITPFVSRNGIEIFMDLIHETIQETNWNMTILTNKPDENNYLINTYLTENHINYLKSKNCNLSILRRRTGEGKIILDNDVLLDNSFMHMKLIIFSYINERNKRKFHGIFTSANLTDKAWSLTNDRLEIGIWVKNQFENKKLHTFVENLKENYCEFTKQELEEITDLTEKLQNISYDEIWLEDRIKNSLEISKEAIILHWKDEYPEINNLTCKINFSNIVSREKHQHFYQFVKNDNILKIVNYMDEVNSENLIIDCIDFEFYTKLKPPEIKLKNFNNLIENEINCQYLKLEEDIKQNWSSIVINNKEYPVIRNENRIKILDQSVIKSITLRKYDQSENYRVSLPIYNQPHLPDNGIISCEFIGNISIINNLYLVCIKISHIDEINPPFDSINFYNEKGINVYFVGFSKNNTEICYYFYPHLISKELLIKFNSPFNRYFNDTFILNTKRVSIDSDKKELFNITSAFHHSLIPKPPGKDIDNFINKSTEIAILHRKKLAKVKELFNNCKIKYFIKENSPIYNEPLLKEISKNVKNLKPFSSYSFWGTLEFELVRNKIYLLFPRKNFIVKEEFLVDIILKDGTYIPKSVYTKSNVLFYVVIRHPKNFIFHNHVSETDINLMIYKNGKEMEIFERKGIIRNEKIWLIPIFKNEHEITISIIAKLINDNEYFSWFLKEKKYLIEKKSGIFKVYLDETRKQMFPIEDNQLKKNFRDMYIEKVHFKTFKEEDYNYFSTFPKEKKIKIKNQKDTVLFFA